MTDMPEILTPEHSEYLGDGVYASFDGYQMWLAANDHKNKVVALEPDVLSRLLEYHSRLVKALMAHGETET